MHALQMTTRPVERKTRRMQQRLTHSWRRLQIQTEKFMLTSKSVSTVLFSSEDRVSMAMVSLRCQTQTETGRSLVSIRSSSGRRPVSLCHRRAVSLRPPPGLSLKIESTKRQQTVATVMLKMPTGAIRKTMGRAPRLGHGLLLDLARASLPPQARKARSWLRSKNSLALCVQLLIRLNLKMRTRNPMLVTLSMVTRMTLLIS